MRGFPGDVSVRTFFWVCICLRVTVAIKDHDQKQVEGKGFIWLMLSKEVRTGPHRVYNPGAGADAKAIEEYCLLVCVS